MNRLMKELSSDSYIVERSNTWCYHIMTPPFSNFYNENLITKKYELTTDTKDFLDILKETSTDWTLAYFKELIAFKNPLDRTISIYPKNYFLDRFNSINDASILNCKSIYFD